VRFATLAVLIAASSLPAISGRAVVADGDTFTIDHVRIRLWGVDAPELHQSCTQPDGRSWACGVQAREALKRLLAGQTVRCEPQYQDRNGRPVSKCSVAGKDLAGRLVASGWALDFPRYSRGAYQSAERTARSRRAGVWQGSVAPPWEWRAGQKDVGSPKRATAEPPNLACRIKGNIGASGQRIAHSPGQRDYEAVRIDITRGERWFCTLAEARVAGWRPAAR
jgi:endonuclease YncB( thermonuclease family)